MPISKSDKELAHAARLQSSREIIEALRIVDPLSGIALPVFEPDPNKPGSYRKTAAAQRLEAATGEPLGKQRHSTD